MAREITIDGVRYAPVDTTDERLQIVVLDRGFVVVGKASIKDNYVTIRDCSCIRRWGTTRGLGQLASEGPQSETKLDPQPTTRVHEEQVVQLIDCEEEAWTQ